MDPSLSVPITNYHEKHESSNHRLPDYRIHRLQNHRYDSVPSPRHDTPCTLSLPWWFPLMFQFKCEMPPQTQVVLHITLEDCEPLGGGRSLDEVDHSGWALRFYCLCHLSCLIAWGPPIQCEQPFRDPATIPSLPWRIRSLLQEWAKIKPLLPQIPPQDILVIVVRKVINMLCEYTNGSEKFLRKKNLCHNFANLIFYMVSQTKSIANIYF